MSQTTTLSDDQVRGLFKHGNAYTKKLLESKYGKDFFLDEDFIKQFLPEFIEACKITGDAPILPFPTYTTEKHRVSNAHYMLDIFHDLFIKKVVLDWTTNQKKWLGWFNDYQPGSGFRFVGSYCGWTRTITTGGARFALESKENSDEFNKKYLPLINIINKPKNQ